MQSLEKCHCLQIPHRCRHPAGLVIAIPVWSNRYCTPSDFPACSASGRWTGTTSWPCTLMLRALTLVCSLALKVRNIGCVELAIVALYLNWFQLSVPSRRNAWKLRALALVPGTNQAKWRWNDSNDVEPQVHQKMEAIPPLAGGVSSDRVQRYSRWVL